MEPRLTLAVMNPSHPPTSPFLCHLLSVLLILANLKSPKGDPPQLRPVTPFPTSLIFCPHCISTFSTLTSLSSFPTTKTSSWTLLDRLQLQVLSDQNLFLFLLSRMKPSYHGKLSWTLRFFQCHRQTPPALLADSRPRSHFNKVPIALRH